MSKKRVLPIVRKAAKALASKGSSKKMKSFAGHILGHQARKGS